MSYPIVLVHGFTRFDHFLARFGPGVYFKGIPAALRKAGFHQVYTPRLAFAESVETRAKQLAVLVRKHCRELNVPKVHLIGHSMGGLDARHAIAGLGWPANTSLLNHVASLTTLATPHLGTPIADLVTAQGFPPLHPLLRLFRIEGLADLRPARCLQFNRDARSIEANNDVIYRAYYAWQKRARTFAPLKSSWQYIYNRGETVDQKLSDGLVSLESQQWALTEPLSTDPNKLKRLAFPVSADHLNELAWWDFSELRKRNIFALRRYRPRTYARLVRAAYVTMAQEVAHIE